jgi:hypothetical protein
MCQLFDILVKADHLRSPLKVQAIRALEKYFKYHYQAGYDIDSDKEFRKNPVIWDEDGQKPLFKNKIYKDVWTCLAVWLRVFFK